MFLLCLSIPVFSLLNLSQFLSQPWSYSWTPVQSHSVSSGVWWCVSSFLFHPDHMSLFSFGLPLILSKLLRCLLHNARHPGSLISQWLGHEIMDVAGTSLWSWWQLSANNSHLVLTGTHGARGLSKFQAEWRLQPHLFTPDKPNLLWLQAKLIFGGWGHCLGSNLGVFPSHAAALLPELTAAGPVLLLLSLSLLQSLSWGYYCLVF